MSGELHETIAGRLRDVGQRYTDGRRVLVERLDAAPQPLAIPDLLAGPPRLPQSSVYRNLDVLVQAGVVHRIVGSGDFARFELAEDLTEHHHHLICSSCGSVADFTVSPQLERSLTRAFDRVAGETGFRASSHRLDLVGVCSSCD